MRHTYSMSIPSAGSSMVTSGFGKSAAPEKRWFVVFTVPQNEKSVARRLCQLRIESYLPTYKVTRVWKNRQRAELELPLFPNYLFVHIDSSERRHVLSSPGVIGIVGNSRGPIPVSDDEIEFLRSEFCRTHAEPFVEAVIGQRVRIMAGPMRGKVGVLIRRKGALRLVLSLEQINIHAAVEVDQRDVQVCHEDVPMIGAA